jgi:hypothetical protein
MRYVQSGLGIESYLLYKILCLYLRGFPRLRNFCPNFAVFEPCPHLFRIAEDPFILILTVLDKADPPIQAHYPRLFNEFHLLKRRAFYQSTSPHMIDLCDFPLTYRRLARDQGFEMDWYFLQPRKEFHYLVMRFCGAHKK